MLFFFGQSKALFLKQRTPFKLWNRNKDIFVFLIPIQLNLD